MKSSLSPLEVKKLSCVVGSHNVGGVPRGTLLLVVEKSTLSKSGMRSHWMYRIIVNKQRLFFGLGTFNFLGEGGGVSLAQARLEAFRIAEDPVAYKKSKDEAKNASKIDEKGARTCATMFVEWLSYQRENHAWKNDKDYFDAQSRFDKYARPVIGDLSPEEVTRDHVLEIVRPIAIAHSSKHGLATKIRSNLSGFFAWSANFAKARDPEKANPANFANLKFLLPKADAVQAHHPACPIEDLPRFIAKLTSPEHFKTMGAKALLFTILTASRHANVCKQERSADKNYAVWEDIDLEKRLWIIPARKMKRPGNGDHIVPLSGAVVRLLEGLEGEHAGCVFHKGGHNPLSNSTMAAVIRRIDKEDRDAGGRGFRDTRQGGRLMTPHGTARGTFASWAQGRLDVNTKLVDLALHHVRDEYQGAYYRGDAIEARRKLMDEWSKFCLSESDPDWCHQ